MTHINPNDLPHDIEGRPIYPKPELEAYPEGTKHLPDGSKRLPDGTVVAPKAVNDPPPNPNDLKKDVDGKLTAESQAIVDAWAARNRPAPKPDKHAKAPEPADEPVLSEADLAELDPERRADETAAAAKARVKAAKARLGIK